GGVARANQARRRPLSVDEGCGTRRKYRGAHDHGIEAWVDIDGVPTAVLGKHTRLARNETTVESRRVVIGHGSVVVARVRVDEPHLLDRKVLLEQRFEDGNHVRRNLAVDP